MLICFPSAEVAQGNVFRRRTHIYAWPSVGNSKYLFLDICVGFNTIWLDIGETLLLALNLLMAIKASCLCRFPIP